MRARSSVAGRNTRLVKKRRQDVLGVALIAASALIATGFGVVYWTTTAESRIDSTSMCPESGPEALTVLLIDATDSITPIQRASLHNYFETLVSGIPVRAAIEMFTVDQIGEKVLHPTGARICNPGRGGSFLTQNPTLIETRWRERFWQPLQQWEQRAVAREPARQSPILESLQSIAVTEFQRPELVSKPRTLVVVSDMLHHTTGFSQYRRIEPFAEFSTSDYYRSIRTDWSGVAVELLYIGRPGTPQGPPHLDFWRQYFAAAGASGPRVTTF